MSTQTRIPDSRLIPEAGKELSSRLPMPLPAALLDRLFMLGRLEAIYSEAKRKAGGGPLFDPLLETLGVRCECAMDELARIPAKGPVVVVANHPFGLLEGPVMGHLLRRIRPDVRFMANSILNVVPELREYVFPVDPFGGAEARRQNLKPLRKCLEWLEGGGLLVVFPAGEVSSLQLRRLRVEDQEWNAAAVRLIQRTSATAVPVYIRGGNGLGFQTAGLVHPRLRTALLPREFLNKRGKTVYVAVGTPISAARLAELPTAQEATEYLRGRAHWLQWRRGSQNADAAARPRRAADVIPAARGAELRTEIDALPASRRLDVSGELAVYLAEAERIPKTLREIGRLREVTFRQAGEGTMRELDLDRFDEHYEHLFVWNAERCEVVGAYRLAETRRVLNRWGGRGLYSASLFHIHDDFFRQLGCSIELGRSFVRSEYQRNYLPLLMLWRGIGQVVTQRPECRQLFGPVSISADYSTAAREMMVSYLAEKCGDAKLRPYVRPRKGFRVRPLVAADIRNLAALIGGMEDLCETVADIEPGGRSIPVLLRQYLNIGGRFLGFNLDDRFSGVVDGLVVVDLLQANVKLLQRYLGREGAIRFLDYHMNPDGSERKAP